MGKQIINGDVEITGQLLKGDLKALYHLGAYDTVDTSNADYDVVTRATGYVDLGALGWTYVSGNNYYISSGIQNLVATPNSDASDAVITWGCNVVNSTYADNVYLGNVGVGISVQKDIYYKNTDTSSSVKPYGILSFKLADSFKYTEKIIKNQPISKLDQNGENWLRGEYDHSVNLFAGNSTSSVQYIGHYYINGGDYHKSANNSYNCFRVPVKANTTYTLSSTQRLYNLARFVDAAFNLISGTDAGYYSSVGTFTTPSDCAYVETMFSTGYSTPIMFNLGSTAQHFADYGGGAIVHEESVAPILLWENPNRTQSFGAQTITITNGDMRKFKFIVFGICADTGVAEGIQCIKVINPMCGTATNYRDQRLTVFTASSKFYRNATIMGSTTMEFGNGYKDGSADSSAAIPAMIWGTNTL